MAQSDILGLFIAPQQYEMQQTNAMRERAGLFASMTPRQRAEFSGYLAGEQFGQGLSGLLGAQDPQLSIISRRQALSQQIDPSDPNSLMAAAQQAAQGGDQQFALTLADYARKAQSELALAQQRMKEGRAAGTPKELQIASARAQAQDTIRQLETQPPSPERDRALQVAKDTLASLPLKTEGMVSEQQIARDLALEKGPEGSDAYNAAYRNELRRLTTKESKEKISDYGQTLVEAGFAPGSAEFQAQMREFAKAKITGTAKGSGTKIELGGINIDTGKAGEAAGKKIGEELVDVKGKEAALDSIKEARDILKRGINAGAYGPAKQLVSKYTGVGSAEKVANTETFLAFIGETVVPRLKEFGGNDSEQELAYLNRIMGGDISVEPKALERILESADRKIRRGIERLRKQAESGEKKQTLTSTLPAPEAAPAPAAPASAPKRIKFSDLPN